MAQVAKAHGIARLNAYTLASNHPMLEVFEHSRFASHRDFADGALRVTLDLTG